MKKIAASAFGGLAMTVGDGAKRGISRKDKDI